MAKSNNPAPQPAATAADKPAPAPAASNQPASTPAAAETDSEAVKAKFVPKVKRLITLPLIKPEIGKPVYIKVLEKMFIGKDISAKEKDPEKKKKAPATLVNCTNLETGELAQMIVPSVLKGIWEDDYPEDSYVEKSFAITKLEKKAGKDYFPFAVAELED